MAKTREDFVQEGRTCARKNLKCVPTGTWTGELPVFGLGQSWQAKAFAEGWKREVELIKAELPSVKVDQPSGLKRSKRGAVNRAARVKSMMAGVVEALFFTNDDLADYELSDELRARLQADCERFYDAAHTDLAAYVDLYPSKVSRDYHPWEAVGHDLWLTRNGHGVGFWDRGMGRVGKRLTDKCGWRTEFPGIEVYADYDNLVYGN